MKRFDILYYFFIVLSMVLSATQAPAMFIEHNALAGWLWILVFMVMLFLMVFEGIQNTAEVVPTGDNYDWFDGTDTKRENYTYGYIAVKEARRKHFGR